MTVASSMKEVVLCNTALQPKLDTMAGKSGSDVSTTAIIGILLFAYTLAAELRSNEDQFN